MGLANAMHTETDGPRDERASGDPSVTSSLEHLVTSSQGVITKRVDLALLEAQEILSRFVGRAALAGVALLLAAGTWFAAAGALVLLFMPNSEPVLQLFLFGLINGAGTLGLVRMIQRSNVPIATADRNGAGESPVAQPSQSEARN